MAAARAPRWPCPPAAMRRRRPTSTMTHALFDIGPRSPCPLTLAPVVGRAARGRRRAASSRFRAQGDKGGEATLSRCSPDIFNLSSRPCLLPLPWPALKCLGPGTPARTTRSHSSKLIRTGIRKMTKKRKRDNHVQRTTAAARRPDDDSHRGPDRRRTDRNDLSEAEWREGREPGGQYAAVRHRYGGRAGPRAART